jgi:HK97 gp10 family phage protein
MPVAKRTRVRVVLSEASINAIGKQDAGKLVIKATLRVLNRAKILAPVDTGNLRASLTQEIKTRKKVVIGRVGTNVNYAWFVHEGTKPHKIKARDAGALRFFWPKVGAVTVVPKRTAAIGKRYTGYIGKDKKTFLIGKGYVDHPGTKGRPFLRTALREQAKKSGFVVKRF